jgi:hypothetical protein
MILEAGNPPYNAIPTEAMIEAGMTNGQNVYFDHINNSANESDISGLLVPQGWMTDFDQLKTMIDNGLMSATEVDSRRFPNVKIRSGLSRYFIEKNYNGPLTLYPLEGESFTVDRDVILAKRSLSFENPKLLSIVDKIANHENFFGKTFDKVRSSGNYPVASGVKGNVDRFFELNNEYNREQSDEYNIPVTIYAGGVKKAPLRVWSSIQPQIVNDDLWTVAIPKASDKNFLGIVLLLPAGEYASEKLTIIRLPEQQAKRLKQWLDSRQVRFIFDVCKTKDSVSHGYDFARIPMIDLDNNYTEDDYDRMFDISSEESDIIRNRPLKRATSMEKRS